MALVLTVAVACDDDDPVDPQHQGPTSQARTLVAAGTPLGFATVDSIDGPEATLEAGKTPRTDEESSDGRTPVSGTPTLEGSTPPPAAATLAAAFTATFPPTILTPSAEVTPSRAPRFAIVAPRSARGPFEVTVRLEDGSAFKAFNVELRFDSELLRAEAVRYGDVLGEETFCPPSVIEDGRALIACTLLGPRTLSGSGIMAVFTLVPVGSGAANLSMTPLSEDQSRGAYVATLDAAGGVVPLAAALTEASVEVAP